MLDGAGYFLFSGIGGVGDWAAVIAGLPHQAVLRTAMAIFGAAFNCLRVKLLASGVRPFIAARSEYNTVGRLPGAHGIGMNAETPRQFTRARQPVARLQVAAQNRQHHLRRQLPVDRDFARRREP